MAEEYKIIGIRKFKSFAELQLIREEDNSVTPSYRVNKALVKLENLSNYALQEFVTVHYKKYGEKWYCFPSSCSTSFAEFAKVNNLNELPF